MDCRVLIEITDRLDLFVSETLRKARNVVPAPRRIIFDISSVREISLQGLNALHQLCSEGEDDSRAVILRKSSEPITFTVPLIPVYGGRAAALAALPETVDQAPYQLTVPLFERDYQ